MEVHKTPNFFLPPLASLLFHLIPSYPGLLRGLHSSFCFTVLPMNMHIGEPFESSILHHKGLIMQIKCSPGEAFFLKRELSDYQEELRAVEFL